jgi:hypothetical protein
MKNKLYIFSVKKIIYNIIKYPLIVIFIKTPFINILKRRFKNHMSLKKRNIIWFVLDTLFQREYFNKLKNKEEMRELTNSTLIDGKGKKWAEYYYNTHFQTLDELKKRRIGIMSLNDASPIFERMINYIKSINLSDDKNTYIIQLGSSSGRDLEFFLKIFPKLNYISTDINDEILDFQKEKSSYPNLKYFKCFAEDIDECINHFKISDKNIILFSNDSLQCVNPFFLEEFFSKIKNYKILNLFISEPVNLLFLDNSGLISEYRGNISFSHRYDEYAKKSGFNIIENKIIRPYSTDDKQHRHTGHFDLQISNLF